MTWHVSNARPPFFPWTWLHFKHSSFPPITATFPAWQHSLIKWARASSLPPTVPLRLLWKYTLSDNLKSEEVATMATRVALLFLACSLPAMVAAIRPERNPFRVQGRVYCDPCRAGFETSKTTYIPGASSILTLLFDSLSLLFKKKKFFFFLGRHFPLSSSVTLAQMINHCQLDFIYLFVWDVTPDLRSTWWSKCHKLAVHFFFSFLLKYLAMKFQEIQIK